MKVNRIEIPIPRSLANRLESSWFKMLARVRYPPAEGIIVTFDGIRYYAASWSQYGFRSGTTWSPAAGTRPAALVGIAEAMRAFALALPADRPALEDRIRSLNEDLLANLATSAPPP
jgi:hypothetical protein